MKLPASINKITPVEMALLLTFVVYIIFPISTPSSLACYIDSPLGYTAVILAGIALFTYTNPILGVLYLFVAYEIFRRSCKHSVPRHNDNQVVQQHLPTRVPISSPSSQVEKDVQLERLNPNVGSSLEEEMVSIRAPINHGSPIDLTPPSFQPVADKLNGASLW